MSKKSVRMDPYIRRKGILAAIIIALPLTALWIVLFRMGLFAPVFGVLVPLVLKKGYEYICDGSPAFDRRILLNTLSVLIAVFGTFGGYWAIFSAMYDDVMFFAVPYAMWDILTTMPEYGMRFLIYLGIGLLCTVVGILLFMRKPKDT